MNAKQTDFASFYHATSISHSNEKKNTPATNPYTVYNTNKRKKLNKLPLFHRAVNRFVCAFTNYAKSFWLENLISLSLAIQETWRIEFCHYQTRSPLENS